MAKAFKNEYDYYRLKKDCLGLKAGAIFYHDKYDNTSGSVMEGCLKLAWDSNGNCFNYAGDAYILHASARKDIEFLELITTSEKSDVIKIITDRINEWIMSADQYPGDYSNGQIDAYKKIIIYLNSLK